MPALAPRACRRAFTIIEIIVILIIMALMLVIVIPHLSVGEKERKARQIKDDLAVLNAAVEHYAVDNTKASGIEVTYADISKYVDPNSPVYLRGGKDVFGDSYGPFTVGSLPPVPPDAINRLSNAVDEDFWSPYR